MADGAALGSAAVSVAKSKWGPDRLLLRYAIVLVLCLLWLGAYDELDDMYNLFIPGLLLVFIPIASVAVYLAVALLINLATRRWMRVVSVLMGPLIGWFAVDAAVQAGFTPQYLHVALVRNSYLSEVSSSQIEAGAFRVWKWGETGGPLTVRVFKLLVYDPSGEIALPPQERSAEWMRQAERSGAGLKVGLRSVVHPENLDLYRKYVWMQDYGGGLYIVTQVY